MFAEGGAERLSNDLDFFAVTVPGASSGALRAVAGALAPIGQAWTVRLGVDVAVSATGLAGPGGGTPECPVGTVHIGLSTRERTLSIPLLLSESGSSRSMSAAKPSI